MDDGSHRLIEEIKPKHMSIIDNQKMENQIKIKKQITDKKYLLTKDANDGYKKGHKKCEELK